MNTLRSAIIRLAHTEPSLRPHLLPLLKRAMEFPTQEALAAYLKDHPKADKSKHSVSKNWDSKSTSKVKGKVLKELGLGHMTEGIRGDAQGNLEVADLGDALTSWNHHSARRGLQDWAEKNPEKKHISPAEVKSIMDSVSKRQR